MVKIGRVVPKVWPRVLAAEVDPLDSSVWRCGRFTPCGVAIWSVVWSTDCYSNGSQRPHRCCHRANRVENIDRGQVWACPTSTSA